MSRLKLDVSVSLDDYLAGPDQTLEEPLGRHGERLHEWAVGTASFRSSHGMEGGETGIDDELATETLAGAGASIMGRRVFSGGRGPWEDDPNADAWWGDDPPFHHPVFVLTHHAREPLEKEGGSASSSRPPG
jgi:dihydrofolate reductase